jgi:hypothetical protein
MVLPQTKIRPQTLLLKVSSSPSELVPSFFGMLWIDPNNILRVDSVGAGVPSDFVTVLPEHTIGGHHGPKVQITQTTPDNALFISKNGAGSAVQISCGSSAGAALTIDQVATSPGIMVSTTTGPGMVVNKSTGGGSAISVSNSGTGAGIQISQNGTTGNALSIGQYPATDYGINLTAAKYGQFINLTGSGGVALRVTTNTNAIEPNPNTGLVYVYKQGTGSSPAMIIDNAGSGEALKIANTTGNGFAVRIRHSGTAAAIRIDSSTAADCMSVMSSGTGVALNIQNSSTSSAISISQSLAQPSSQAAITIANTTTGGRGIQLGLTNSSNPDVALYINNRGQGAAIYVEQTGGNRSLTIYQAGVSDAVYINKSSTGNAAISIANAVGGTDIYSANWQIYQSGLAQLNSLSLFGGNKFRILTGVVAANGSIANSGTGGWTATKTGTGTYRITFSVGFAATPVVILTGYCDPGVTLAVGASVVNYAVSNSYVDVETWILGEDLADRRFGFQIMGW